jgi:hypothetical protein
MHTQHKHAYAHIYRRVVVAEAVATVVEEGVTTVENEGRRGGVEEVVMIGQGVGVEKEEEIEKWLQWDHATLRVESK